MSAIDSKARGNFASGAASSSAAGKPNASTGATGASTTAATSAKKKPETTDPGDTVTTRRNTQEDNAMRTIGSTDRFSGAARQAREKQAEDDTRGRLTIADQLSVRGTIRA